VVPETPTAGTSRRGDDSGGSGARPHYDSGDGRSSCSGGQHDEGGRGRRAAIIARVLERYCCRRLGYHHRAFGTGTVHSFVQTSGTRKKVSLKKAPGSQSIGKFRKHWVVSGTSCSFWFVRPFVSGIFSSWPFFRPFRTKRLLFLFVVRLSQAVLVGAATRPNMFYGVPAARLALDGVIYL